MKYEIYNAADRLRKFVTKLKKEMKLSDHDIHDAIFLLDWAYEVRGHY